MLCLDREALLIHWGPLNLELWFQPSMWSVSFHTLPCCYLFLEFGPLCIAVHNYGGDSG